MNKIKEKRIAKGISIRQLSRLSGVNRRTIMLIEKEETKTPYDYTIARLEKALNG